MADASHIGPTPAAGSRAPRRRARARRSRAWSSRRTTRILVGIALACVGFAAIAAWQRLTEPAGAETAADMTRYKGEGGPFEGGYPPCSRTVMDRCLQLIRPRR